MPAMPRILAPGRVAILALAMACVACPSNLEDPGRFLLDGAASNPTTGCGDITQTVFIPTCAMSACHSTATKQQGLDLESPDLLSRLVNVPSTEGAGLLIDPSTPSASVLYTKVTATPPFGVRMPFNLPALDDATVACVLQWVTEQVSDAGATDASDDTSASDDTGTSPPGDDGSTPIGDDGAAVEAAAPMPDAGAPPKDASSPPGRDAGPPDASTPDASTTPDASVRDAGSPVDAKAD